MDPQNWQTQKHFTEEALHTKRFFEQKPYYAKCISHMRIQCNSGVQSTKDCADPAKRQDATRHKNMLMQRHPGSLNPCDANHNENDETKPIQRNPGLHNTI